MNPFRRFQFSLKDLFLAVALIAVGLRGLMMPISDRLDYDHLGMTMLLWYGPFVALGAGMGVICRRTFAGGMVGFWIGIAVFVSGVR